MPIVTHKISDLTIPNDASASVHNGHVDLSLLLSEYYSKNIRQGNNFQVKAISASMLPASGSTQDWDTGGSATVKMSYCPTQKLTRPIVTGKH